MALAYKELTEADYAAIKAMLTSAYNDIVARNRLIGEAFELIESGMTLIGSTAIEDKLQEDVALTLETLRRGGIKIWVLTGDKTETAINISNACKHFSQRYPIAPKRLLSEMYICSFLSANTNTNTNTFAKNKEIQIRVKIVPKNVSENTKTNTFQKLLIYL